MAAAVDTIVLAFLTTFLLVYFLLCSTLSGNVGQVWTPASYPEPSRELDHCGRFGLASQICDPDALVSLKGANIVENILGDIKLPAAPYAQAPCDGLPNGRQGYEVGCSCAPVTGSLRGRCHQPADSTQAGRCVQVRMALMRQMSQPGYTLEEAAASFAAQLFHQWGMASAPCGTGILLLLCSGTHQVRRGAKICCPDLAVYS